MILIVVKIIIFIVILILIYNFTLKKYVGKYVDNYDEIMNHMYYTNNSDKDVTGVYNKNIKLNEYSGERLSYLEYDENGSPILNQNEENNENSENSKNNQNSDNTDNKSSTVSPSPSSSTSNNYDNCSLCSSYTNLDDDNNKICFKNDPSGKNIECSCRKVCNKCPDLHFDKIVNGKYRFIEKNVESSTKECFCDADSLLTFRGDKCEDQVNIKNKPPPGFVQILGGLFALDLADLYEIGYFARNARRIKARSEPLGKLADDAMDFSKNSRVKVNKLKGELPDEIFKKLDETYDFADDIFDRTKNLGSKVEMNIPFQRVNDDFINLGRKIDSIRDDLKNLQYTDEMIDGVLNDLKTMRNVQKSKTYRNLAKYVDPDYGKDLKVAMSNDLLDNFTTDINKIDDVSDLKTTKNIAGVDNVKVSNKMDDIIKGFDSLRENTKIAVYGRKAMKSGKVIDGVTEFKGFQESMINSRMKKVMRGKIKPMFDDARALAKNIDEGLDLLKKSPDALDATSDVAKQIAKLEDMKKVVTSGNMEQLAYLNLEKNGLRKVLNPEEMKRLAAADALSELADQSKADQLKKLADDSFKDIFPDNKATNSVNQINKVGDDITKNIDTGVKNSSELNINKPKPTTGSKIDLPDAPKNVIKALDEARDMNQVAKTTRNTLDSTADFSKVLTKADDATGAVVDAAKIGTKTVDTSADLAKSIAKTTSKISKSGGKGFGAISKMGKIATKMGKYAGPGMAIIGAGACFGFANADPEMTDKERAEENAACGVQLAIDLAIEAAMYVASASAMLALGPLAAALVIFMVVTAVADMVDDCGWNRPMYTDDYLKNLVDQSNSTFFAGRGDLLASSLNIAIYDFVSSNFEKEKIESKYDLKIYFKYFFDTSISNNIIEPKWKDNDKTKEINIDLVNEKEKLYDHLKVSKQNGLTICSLDQLDNCYQQTENVFGNFDINDIELDANGKLSEEKKNNLILRIKSEWKYCIPKKYGKNLFTSEKPIKLAKEENGKLVPFDKDENNIDYNEYEVLIVPLRDSNNKVLYNKISGEIQWKIVSRNMQKSIDDLLEKYGDAARDYFNGFSLPELCSSWYGDLIDDMEVRLIDVVEKVYINSNRSVLSMGKSFLDNIDKNFGKGGLDCGNNCSDLEIQKAMKECIQRIIDDELDKRKYTTPMEFNDYFLYPGSLIYLNENDKKEYVNFIKEYYVINRISLPDFTDEELYEFFLRATKEETENRADRGRKMLTYAKNFINELTEQTEAKKRTLELLNKRNKLAENSLKGMLGSLRAAQNLRAATVERSIYELKVREYETKKRTLKILRKKNMDNLDKQTYQDLLKKFKDEQDLRKDKLLEFKDRLENNVQRLTKSLTYNASTTEQIDDYNNFYYSISPEVRKVVLNKVDQDNSEEYDVSNDIDSSFIKNLDKKPSKKSLYILYGVEFIVLLIVFILFSIFIF